MQAENTATRYLQEFKESIIPSVIPSGETYVIDLRFTINSPDFSEFNLELERFKNKIIQNSIQEGE
ncbi:hypothetical protein ABQE01_02245 [Enterococcus thailandicus]|uniref:hypothetical protein n=1 Tax=Enterococcus thailandicus TaxID=417368 RepID=UPI0032E3D059